MSVWYGCFVMQFEDLLTVFTVHSHGNFAYAVENLENIRACNSFCNQVVLDELGGRISESQIRESPHLRSRATLPDYESEV